MTQDVQTAWNELLLESRTDTKAFNAFCCEMVPWLTVWAEKYVSQAGPQAEAQVQEIVAETLRRVWLGRSDFVPQHGPAWAWVRTIARSVARGLRNEAGRAARAHPSSPADAGLPALSSEERDLSPLLRETIAGLSEDDRQVWERSCAGMSPAETMDHLWDRMQVPQRAEDCRQVKVVKAKIRGRLLDWMPAEDALAQLGPAVYARAEAEAGRSTRHLRRRLGLLDPQPVCRAPINWKEVERLLFGGPD